MQTRQSRLIGWQWLTVLLMLFGYSGYYLCRSNFSVALPMIADELVRRRGFPAETALVRLGTIASLGVAAYAVGKFPAGAIADHLGGRRNFLGGMAGSVVFTLLFAVSGGLPLFTLAWVGNRLAQSWGWAGIVKVSSRWFSYRSYGTVMAVLSLSFLFGDAACRAFLAWLIGEGLGWRGIFAVAAATLLFLFFVNLVLLKETPLAIGEAEPPANPLAIVLEREEGQRSGRDLSSVLRPLFADSGFWLVCVLSFTFTLVRETFNLWTPTYFVQVVGLSPADAACESALFPLFGGFSVLLSGVLRDRLRQGGRASVIICSLLLAGVALLLLGNISFGDSRAAPVGLVALVGFLMIGPYSYFAGAIALDLGGKYGSATASGIIDGVGYLGGILAGDSIARLSVAYGWRGAFTTLAIVVWLSSIVALFYRRHALGKVLSKAI